MEGDFLYGRKGVVFICDMYGQQYCMDHEASKRDWNFMMDIINLGESNVWSTSQR